MLSFTVSEVMYKKPKSKKKKATQKKATKKTPSKKTASPIQEKRSTRSTAILSSQDIRDALNSESSESETEELEEAADTDMTDEEGDDADMDMVCTRHFKIESWKVTYFAMIFFQKKIFQASSDEDELYIPGEDDAESDAENQDDINAQEEMMVEGASFQFEQGDTLNIQLSPDIEAAVKKIRETAKFFRRSPVNNDILQKYVKVVNKGKGLNLILDVKTRVSVYSY